LGISYKANISDYRESPTFEIIDEAKKQGYIVSTFDPYILDKSTSNNISDAMKNSVAVIIATNHKEFTALTPEFFIKNKISIVVDGRNCLDKEKFTNKKIIYKGIGR
jgi:UDP-N-acetyl-D-mannosaminuronate dehydrogenase